MIAAYIDAVSQDQRSPSLFIFFIQLKFWLVAHGFKNKLVLRAGFKPASGLLERPALSLS